MHSALCAFGMRGETPGLIGHLRYSALPIPLQVRKLSHTAIARCWTYARGPRWWIRAMAQPLADMAAQHKAARS